MENWIHVDSQSGTGDKVIQVTVDENQTLSQRSTSLTFETSEGTTAVATINQSAGVRTYGVPTIEISYPDAPAKGGVISPVWSITQTWGWNGSSTNGGTIEIDNTTPDKPESLIMEYIVGVNKGVSFDTSTGVATVSSLETTVKSRETILSGHVEVTLNGVSSLENSGDFQLIQEANAVESWSYEATVTNRDDRFQSPETVSLSGSGSVYTNRSLISAPYTEFEGSIANHRYSSVRGTSFTVGFYKKDVYTSESTLRTSLTVAPDQSTADTNYDIVGTSGKAFNINLKPFFGLVPASLPTRSFRVTTETSTGTDTLTVGFKQAAAGLFFVAGSPVPDVGYCTYAGKVTSSLAAWTLSNSTVDTKCYAGVVIGKDSTFTIGESDYYLLENSGGIEATEESSWIYTGTQATSMVDTDGMVPIRINANTSGTARRGNLSLDYPNEINDVSVPSITVAITQEAASGENLYPLGLGGVLTLKSSGISGDVSSSPLIVTAVFETATGTQFSCSKWWDRLSPNELSGYNSADIAVPAETLTLKAIKFDFSNFPTEDSDITFSPLGTITITSSPSGVDKDITLTAGTWDFDSKNVLTIPVQPLIGGDKLSFTPTFNNNINMTGDIVLSKS